MQKNEETLQGGVHRIACSLKDIVFNRNMLTAVGYDILGGRKTRALD